MAAQNIRVRHAYTLFRDALLSSFSRNAVCVSGTGHLGTDAHLLFELSPQISLLVAHLHIESFGTALPQHTVPAHDGSLFCSHRLQRGFASIV
jgi:hypothetical protein